MLVDAGLEVKVKDPPKGMIPPGTQLIKPKAEPQPNKVWRTEKKPLKQIVIFGWDFILFNIYFII